MGGIRYRAFIWTLAFLANELADSNRRYDDECSNDDYNRKLVRDNAHKADRVCKVFRVDTLLC